MAFPKIHHPMAFTFGVLGNFISFLVYMAPIPTFYRIWRKKSTEGFQSAPYLVTLFSSMLWLYYALIKGNSILLVTINSFGCVIEMVYIILYLTYARRDARRLTIKYFISMNLGAFSFFILITRYAAPDHLRVAVFGWICVAVSVCVFASPLSIVRQVVRTKSVEFMPFPLSLSLTLGAVMWFGYGLFSHDKCIYIPNIIGFFLGLLQMLLYVVYRRAERAILDEKLPEHFRDIIAMTTFGAREVYPVDIPQAAVGKDGSGATEHPSGHDDKETEEEGSEDGDLGPNRDSAVCVTPGTDRSSSCHPT